MIFLSKPSVYNLPGTWEKQPDAMIPHLNLTPDAKMHELGIAHGHGGNKEAYEMSGKLTKHSHEEDNAG
jgi:hypothetical protein